MGGGFARPCHRSLHNLQIEVADMKVLVVGGGGREHAIVKQLRRNPEITELYCLPGNGGIARDAVCVPIAAKDIPHMVEFAREHAVDYVVVAPDDPLALGAVDALSEVGIPAFGPTKKAAEIESSKVFAKRLMQKYHIPTAAFAVFTDEREALTYLEDAPIPTVIKADGLALGKGVVIAQTRAEAKAAVHAMMADRIFGDSGARILIEECLEGPEVSVLSFTDGTTVVPMVSSMDHKRAHDGDEGPNTGGMGAVAPNPFYTPEIAQRCMDEIFLPTVRAMKAEGREFRGCLYFGLMLTDDGPKVIEYNCRFGDPETQVVLPLLRSDLLTVFRAVTDGRLAETEVRFSARSACCVVLVSAGYPTHYDTGCELTLPPEEPDVSVFVAGAKRGEDGVLRTSGGRVLGVTAVAPTLAQAVKKAYQAAQGAAFANKYCRSDIGARALAAEQED